MTRPLPLYKKINKKDQGVRSLLFRGKQKRTPPAWPPKTRLPPFSLCTHLSGTIVERALADVRDPCPASHHIHGYEAVRPLLFPLAAPSFQPLSAAAAAAPGAFVRLLSPRCAPHIQRLTAQWRPLSAPPQSRRRPSGKAPPPSPHEWRKQRPLPTDGRGGDKQWCGERRREPSGTCGRFEKEIVVLSAVAGQPQGGTRQVGGRAGGGRRGWPRR